MKKIKNVVIICILCFIPLFSKLYPAEPAVEKNQPINIEGSYAVYNYNQLKEKADMIVLCTAMDELSTNNSYIRYNQDFSFPVPVDFYAIRTVEIEYDFLRDSKDNVIINIVEPAAITEHNQIIEPAEYDSLKKGEEYILFLSKENALNEWMIISAGNGVIDLSEDKPKAFSDILQGFTSDKDFNLLEIFGTSSLIRTD